MPSMVVSIAQACETLGCKRSKVFELLRAGVLEAAVRHGREVRIFKASVERALLPAPSHGRKRRVPRSPAGFGSLTGCLVGAAAALLLDCLWRN